MSDDTRLPSIVPTLLPHAEPEAAETVAEQGPPPADFATRPAPAVPAPDGERLSADQVAQLVGGSGAATDANLELDQAEGVDPGLNED